MSQKAIQFSGFSSNPSAFSKLPDEFFSSVLNQVSDVDELKITLYCLWFISKKETSSPWVSWQNIITDKAFLEGLSKVHSEALMLAGSGIAKAVERGTLLTNFPKTSKFDNSIFVPNSPFGRAYLKNLNSEKTISLIDGENIPALERDRPNIYMLYEQHIGTLTPMISDILLEAEKDFPVEWLEEAMQVAVKNNVRRWTYIEAILKRWKQEGRNEKERRDNPEDRRKYVNGKYGDIIKH